MTLNQFVGVNQNMTDMESGEVLNWKEYMSRVVNKIGLEELRRFLPYDLSKIKEAYEKDKNLNNTSMEEWHRASGFWKKIGVGQKLEYIDLHCGLKEYLPKIGVDTFCVGECVCILKETARILCECGANE